MQAHPLRDFHARGVINSCLKKKKNPCPYILVRSNEGLYAAAYQAQIYVAKLSGPERRSILRPSKAPCPLSGTQQRRYLRFRVDTPRRDKAANILGL